LLFLSIINLFFGFQLLAISRECLAGVWNLQMFVISWVTMG